MMTDRHALKFSLLATQQQQRIMKKLAEQARTYHASKQGQGNAAGQADVYDWHRRVKLAREASALNIFRAFLKGTPYKKVEENLREGTLSADRVVKDYLSVAPYHRNLMLQFYHWLGK